MADLAVFVWVITGAAGVARETESCQVRVAIDGSFLSLSPSGVGTYLRSLTTALRDLEPALDVTLLEPQWHDHQAHPSPPLRGPLARLRHDPRLRRASWDFVGVARAAARTRPDLLHIPNFAAPFRSPAPLVVTIHDVIPLVLPEYRASHAMRINLRLVRRTVRAARLIIAPSRAAAADIAHVLGIDPARIRITPEAAGPEFTLSDDVAADLDAVRLLGVTGRYIFNVGGLDVRKNLPTLLEAFARLLPRLAEPVQLIIAGAPHSANPAVFPPLGPVIQRLGLERHVLLTGRISDADKVALYRAADLYVTPSRYEGFGLTALEAMACGVPTIAANRTSLPEVVGDAGLLVEPEPEPLAAAMLHVLTDPLLASDLRHRGIARAATFTWRRTAELTLDAYREALDHGRRTDSASD